MRRLIIGFDDGIERQQVTHGGGELRKASPCPLCFNPIAARELRLTRVLRVAPAKASREAGITANRV